MRSCAVSFREAVTLNAMCIFSVTLSLALVIALNGFATLLVVMFSS